MSKCFGFHDMKRLKYRNGTCLLKRNYFNRREMKILPNFVLYSRLRVCTYICIYIHSNMCVLIVKHNHVDTVVEKHYIAQIRFIENEPTVSKRKGRGGSRKRKRTGGRKWRGHIRLKDQVIYAEGGRHEGVGGGCGKRGDRRKNCFLNWNSAAA